MQRFGRHARTGVLPLNRTTDFNSPAWASGLTEPAPLPVLTGDLTAEVCVIGLGGSGLGAIRRLQELGVDVIGLDAGPVAGAAAGRNGGLLLGGTAAFHHDAVRELGEEAAVSWYRDTMTEIDRMLAETPLAAHRTGSLRIAADEAELADCLEQQRLMEEHGLPVEPYRGPEGAGLLFPHDAVYNPLARNRELARRAVRGGARLFTHSPVTELLSSLVRTERGSVRCQHVIVASDGSLAQLLPELADDVRPVRLQMIGTEPLGEMLYSRPVYWRYGFEYWQQLADGRLLLGGFRDGGGSAELGAEPVPAAPVQELLERFLRETLGVTAAITHRWAARVGYRDGVLPFFAEVRPGITAIGGYNGTGNVIGSLLGRRAASAVTAAG